MALDVAPCIDVAPCAHKTARLTAYLIFNSLSPQVHLLTAHSWGPTTLLLRLSHSYEAGEGGIQSAPASVDLATLFKGVSLSACVETTMSGNQALATAPKTTYVVQNGGPTVTLPIVPAPPAGAAMTSAWTGVAATVGAALSSVCPPSCGSPHCCADCEM